MHLTSYKICDAENVEDGTKNDKKKLFSFQVCVVKNLYNK